MEVDRRGLFIEAKRAVLRTVAVLGLKEGLGLIPQVNVGLRRDQLLAQSQSAFKTESELQVAYFAQDVIESGQRLTQKIPEDNLKGMFATAFSADISGGYLLRNYSDLAQKRIGVLTTIAGRIIDFYSNIALEKAIADPRFKEYGFDNYLRKINPYFSPLLTKPDLNRGVFVISTAAGILGSWIQPNFARGYLGVAPFNFKNNQEGAFMITASMQVGDTVKSMIAEGRKESEVREFLAMLAPGDNRTLENQIA